MARLMWAILCERVITAQDTNTVSYIDVLEEASVTHLPAPALPIFVSAVWARQAPDEKLQMRIRVLSPDGKELTRFEVPEITLARPRQRVNVQLGGYSMHEPGQHEFSVERMDGGRWVPVAMVPFDIKLAPPQAAIPA